MYYRFTLLVLLLCLAARIEAAMARLVEVTDARTLVVERDGKRETIILAGVEITHQPHALAYLQWALPAGTWVMLEPVPGGAHVYRSPDATFLNRELVLRGFASPTSATVTPPSSTTATYLGVVHPMHRGAGSGEARARPKKTSGRGTTKGRAKSNSGTSRRPPASPSRSSAAPSPSADASPSPSR
jgi:hypothetical protein